MGQLLQQPGTGKAYLQESSAYATLHCFATRDLSFLRSRAERIADIDTYTIISVSISRINQQAQSDSAYKWEKSARDQLT